jgi:hypothetical protein
MSEIDLEERLRSELHTALGDGPRIRDGWDDVDARLRPAVARRRRRVALVVAAASVVVIAAVSVVATRSDGERVRTGPVGPGPTSASTATSVATGTQTRVLATVPVTTPSATLARPDGLWYVGPDEQSLVHIDPSGRTVGQVTWRRTDSHYGSYGGPVHLASGEGSIWVLFWATGTLLRVDPATMAVTGRNVLGGQGTGFEVEDVAAGLGHVWVTVCCNQGPSQRLYRIDPATMNVDAQVALPGQGESQRVVAGAQGVFVTGEQFATVVQVDPSGRRILRQIPVPGGAGPVALGAEVWVLGGWNSGSSTGTTLSTIDPTTGARHLVANLPSPVQEIAASSSAVWVGGVDSVGGFGPIFELTSGSAATVGGTVGAYRLTTSGNVLWFYRAGKVVEIRLST